MNNIVKSFSVEVINEIHHNALLYVCRKNNFTFEDCRGEVVIYEYLTPLNIRLFFEEVGQREDELKNAVNVSLTEEQKIVIDKVMGMLADANIGLCHDNKNTGELMAFNSSNGKTYACNNAVNSDEIWFDEDEIIGTPSVLPNTYNGKRIYSFYHNGGFATKK